LPRILIEEKKSEKRGYALEGTFAHSGAGNVTGAIERPVIYRNFGS